MVPTFMLAEFQRSSGPGHRHFLYGGGPNVSARLAVKMRERFPGLSVVGTHEPPFAPLDQLASPETPSAINATGADVVWVGISSPKQSDGWR